jgi:Zn-dependent alcohol dehydrogenase
VLDGEKAKAAVCREMNKPVVVEEIEIESPGRDQVMIKLFRRAGYATAIFRRLTVC